VVSSCDGSYLCWHYTYHLVPGHFEHVIRPLWLQIYTYWCVEFLAFPGQQLISSMWKFHIFILH
jgi:hypothetical protein